MRLAAASSVTISLVPRAIHELLCLTEEPIASSDVRAHVANVLRGHLNVELRRIFSEVMDPWPREFVPAVHVARFLDPRTVREMVIPTRLADDGGDDDDAGNDDIAPYTPSSVAMIQRIQGVLKDQLPCVSVSRRRPDG